MHTLRVYRPLRSHGHASTLARSALGVGIGSHLASMIVKQIWTDFEKVAPGSALRSGCPRLRGPRRVRRLRGLGLRHLFGLRPVFLCNYRSHLVLMIAKKIRTKLEKVAPGSALHSGCPRLCGPRRVRRLGGLGLRSLLGSCPVFLCSYCSHFGLDDCKEDPDEIREGDVRFCSGAWVACSGVIRSEWSFPRASSQPLWVRRPF